MRTLAISTFAICTIAIVSPAQSATTLLSVDESRVSAVEGIGTTSAITVWGGVTGASTGLKGGTCASPSDTSTCNNCADAGLSGDAALLPCNAQRIHPQLIAVFRIRSSVAGTPRVTVQNTSSQEPVTILNSGTVSANSDVDIQVRWLDICMKVKNSAGNGVSDANCVLTADEGSAILRVGIDGDNNSELEGDEYASVTVRLRDGVDSTGTGGSSLADPTLSGITYFEIGSGDTKAFIKVLRAANGFPNGNNIAYRSIRALYEQRDPSTPTTEVWDQINSGSRFADLDVQGTVPEDISVSPSRITGLENDQIYDFKLALVDAARNVGYYTPAADDAACDDPVGSAGGGGGPECHTARPSEVVGVLGDTMNCFVATAAFGTPMSKQVDILRMFRDRFLIPTKAGSSFVRFYYKEGPKLAAVIAKSETLRAVSRAALWAPIQFAKISLAYGLSVAIALLAFTLLAPPTIWIGVRQISQRRNRGPRA